MIHGLFREHLRIYEEPEKLNSELRTNSVRPIRFHSRSLNIFEIEQQIFSSLLTKLEEINYPKIQTHFAIRELQNNWNSLQFASKHLMVDKNDEKKKNENNSIKKEKVEKS